MTNATLTDLALHQCLTMQRDGTDGLVGGLSYGSALASPYSNVKAILASRFGRALC